MKRLSMGVMAVVFATCLAGAAVLGFLLRGEPSSTKVVVTETMIETVTQTATRSTAPVQTIYVPQAGGDVEYKPEAMFIGVSAPGPYAIKWETYGDSEAIGTATFESNDCVPDCASGHRTERRGKLRLSNIGPCKGVPAYRTMRVNGESTETDLGALCSEG